MAIDLLCFDDLQKYTQYNPIDTEENIPDNN